MATDNVVRDLPLVSIVIPAYNHGQFVGEAIDSILDQDYPSTELIVVDDGSTDNTREVLARYTARVEAISQPNAGQAATIRWAWARAKGEILSYLSADDRLAKNAVSSAVAALAAHPAAVMVYGDYELIDPASTTVRRVRAPEFNYARMVRHLECAPGPGVFVRRAAASAIDGWNPAFRQAPDFEYWLRLGLVGTFQRMPVVLAGYRVHPGSVSFAATTHERAEEPVRIMEAYFQRSDLPSEISSLQRESLSSAHLLAARAHLRARRVRDAARSTRRAALLSPTNLLTARTGRLLLNALINRTGHSVLWSLRRIATRTRTVDRSGT